MAIEDAFGGGGSSADQQIDNLTNQIDGERTTFTTSRNYETGKLKVYWNGIRQVVGGSGSTITEAGPNSFSFDSDVPVVGNVLIVDYPAAN